MATSCPHCAQVVRAALRISLSHGDVSTFVIDAQWHPELAGRFAVRSVPTVVFDEGLSVTGEVSQSELTERLSSRVTDEYPSLMFQSLVDTGRFADAAASG